MFPAVTRTSIGLLIVTIAMYGFDCVGMTTPAQAMQCCKSMRCMSHHHLGQDCCKMMPTTRIVIGQPVFAALDFSHVAVGVLQTCDVSSSIATSERLITYQSHAPPIFGPPTVLALRI